MPLPREQRDVVDRLRMRLAETLEEAAETARSGMNAALLARDLITLRRRLAQAVETFRFEDVERVADELHRAIIEHAESIRRGGRAETVRLLATSWLDAVERAQSCPPDVDVSALYADAAATEDDDDREFHRAAELAAAERWND